MVARRRAVQGSAAEHGQAIVEVALTLPVLLLLILGIFEFALVLNSRNTVYFASRDASMLAAEGGSIAGTDCVVLDRIERDIVSPAKPVRVISVKIFWSDRNGVEFSGNENLYTRGGTTTCTYNGSTLTVPYTLTTAGYLEDARCDVRLGCGGGHTSPDTIGVTVSYQHSWVTSVAQIATSAITFSETSATRIEPQQ